MKSLAALYEQHRPEDPMDDPHQTHRQIAIGGKLHRVDIHADKVTRWRTKHSHLDAFSDYIITTRQLAEKAWAWRRTESAEPQAWEGLDHMSSRFAREDRTPEKVRAVLEACLQG